MNVVVSQSMLFPWVGMLEQIRLADVFVHYDDVQFSKGSYTNRVQLKTANGRQWMTIPLEGHKFGQAINEVSIKSKRAWNNKHLDLLEKCFRGAPYATDALDIAALVYSKDYESIGMLARNSMLAVSEYYGLLDTTKLIDIVSLNIPGSSSERVVNVVKAVKGTEYITGHGARKYLDYDLFEESRIRVKFIDYKCVPYSQMHGDFTPYVSSLDLIANCGPAGISCISSSAVYWKEFLSEPE